MAALREVAAIFGVEFDDSKLKAGNASINHGIGLLKAFGALVAGNALVQGVFGFADSFADAAGQVKDSAALLDLSTAELQELQHAAVMGGAGAETMTAALANLNQRLGATKSGPAAAALRALGVSAKEADGTARSLGDIMDDVAQGMSGVENPARRAALANQLFGGAGRRLLPILKEGEGGVAALRAEIEALGGAMSQESIDAADDYGDAMDRFKVASTSLRSTVATELLPVLTRFAEWITKALAQFARLTRGTHVMQVALVALGVAAAAAGASVVLAWAPVLAPILGMAAAVGTIILAVDDFITMMEGGDSVLGRFIDRHAGMGAQRNTVRSLNEAWDGLKLAIRGGGENLSEFGRDVSEIGENISLAFGKMTASVKGSWNTITGVVTGAWASIENATGGALGRMWDQITAFVAPVVNVLRRIGSAIGTEMQSELDAMNPAQRGRVQSATPAGVVAGAVGAAGSGIQSVGTGFADVFRSTLDDWRGLVLNVPTTGGRAQTVAAPASRNTTTTTQRTTTIGPIAVHATPGMDERRLAREVTRQIERHEAARNDEAHPATHPEED